MKYLKSSLIIVQLISLARSTCVFDSDFGFILNCNFKKSGLFRVRNLGGVKAHFGLGFSVGDDLGFAESLGNLEGGRRRALNYRTSLPNNIGVLPASNLPIYAKPIEVNNLQQSKVISNARVTKNANYNKTPSQLMTEAASLPLGVPAFRPIPYKKPIVQAQQSTSSAQTILSNPFQNTNRIIDQTTFRKNNGMITRNVNKQQFQLNNNKKTIPPFQALPSQTISRISLGNTYEIESNQFPVHNFDNIHLPEVDLMGHSLEELAQAANVSVDAVKHAINMRQQQLLLDYYNANEQKLLQQQSQHQQQSQQPQPQTTEVDVPPLTTQTFEPSSTTESLRPMKSTPKVMNAPKEYYPIGYEKNFDDNFTTKVDLPSTPFNCGNQKHFPGLYADINLGCMVFHVCALTDDGLIMKSFLCPESTLFDQTILKCNWWFYVDCKHSKNIYDSNIPISKSYQLMKSLTYFSNYNKQQINTEQQNNTEQQQQQQQHQPEDFDLEALKNTVNNVDEQKTS